MAKDKDFKGMILTLKKRMNCTQKDDTGESDFLMFGHYDGLTLHCIDKWYHMRPGADTIKAGTINVKDTFQDKYTIKMYFPKKRFREKLDKRGFCYQFWEKDGFNRTTDNSILKECPFISVAVLNLNKEYVRNNKNYFSDIADRLSKILEDERFSKVYCALFPSIGYSDYVCLFLTDNPGKTVTLLDKLKMETFLRKAREKEQKDQFFPMLSNFYVITGFAKIGLQNIGMLSDITLSIRVNLCEGVSVWDFRNYFLKEAVNEFAISEDKLSSYHMFGSSDCLIIPDMSFNKFIPLYFDSKLLNPGNKLFKDYISSISSSLCVKVQDQITSEKEIEGNIDENKYRDGFDKIVKKLTEVATEYKRPVRGVYGLERVMKIFLNLLRSSHSFDVEYVIGRAFNVLLYNIDKTINLIARLDGADRSEMIDNLWEAVRLFREMAGDYLSDMQRSDSSFIEGQSLSHPSIGSATKFLLFYNKYVNEISALLSAMEEDKSKRTYTFIVTSGGNDMTVANDLFAYLDPADKEDQSLIVIQIPEMSLYDVKGTMFRLLHECMHFCGERKRKLRMEALLEAYAISSADMFCKYIENSIYHNVKDVEVQGYRVDFHEFRQLCEKEKKKTDSIEIRLKTKTKELLERSLDEVSANENFYYGRNLYKTVYEKSIQKVFIPIMKDEASDGSERDKRGEMARYAYECLLEYQKYISEKINECVETKGEFYTDADLLYATAMNKLSRYRSEENEIDQEESDIILRAIERYIGNIVQQKSEEKINEEEIPEALEILDLLFALFKEVYADCMAVKILNVSIEDFILAFVYEVWNLNTAFPDHGVQICRFGLEMEVLYGITGRVSEEIRQKIRDKMLSWRERGFCYGKKGEKNAVELKKYAKELCDWLDRHLVVYEERFREKMEPVENYIKECISYLRLWMDKKGNEENAEKIKEIRKSYQYADLDTDEKMYKMMECIGEAWKGMAFWEGKGI